MIRFFTRHTSNCHTPWYGNKNINFLSPELRKRGLAKNIKPTHAIDVLQNKNRNDFVKSEIPFAGAKKQTQL